MSDKPAILKASQFLYELQAGCSFTAFSIFLYSEIFLRAWNLLWYQLLSYKLFWLPGFTVFSLQGTGTLYFIAVDNLCMPR